ncbi:MAG: DEAD/DEAH box helicase [Pseudomonadota bacterium]
MNDFDGVARPLAQALAVRGYETATPVQKAVTEPSLASSDLLVSARTGSGKTVAFGIASAPTLLNGQDRLEPAASPLALIITPTRELALQVMAELEWLYAKTGAQFASCVGGMNPRTERRTLEAGAHIVVGTPGRLRDHITRRALDLSELKVVVLDEADEMLDLGFRDDLEFILEAAPENRRTLLFSATVSKPIEKLAKTFQKDAVRVVADGEKLPHADISYEVMPVAGYDRDNAITNLLRFHEADVALVFCNTRAAVARLASRLSNRGFSVAALSGELSQAERNNALQALRDGRSRVCVATDVAARGIDLPNLDLVIHADLPTGAETLLHRSGRTGRAGRKGVSAVLVDPRARPKAERLLRHARIEYRWAHPPTAHAVAQRDEERILAQAASATGPTEEERSFIAQLQGKFSAEQLATAYLRQWNQGRCAPEELDLLPLDGRRSEQRSGGKDKPERVHKQFEQSVWLSLSVGRKQRAEPRWLIPLLCKSGGIHKRSIGSIKMHTDETRVELDGNIADAFLDRVGPDLTLEKSIRVKVLDAAAARKAPEQTAKNAARDTQGEEPNGKPAREKSKEARGPRPGRSKPRTKPKGGDKARFKPKPGSKPKTSKSKPRARKGQ